jgi:hypothetical protein
MLRYVLTLRKFKNSTYLDIYIFELAKMEMLM